MAGYGLGVACSGISVNGWGSAIVWGQHSGMWLGLGIFWASVCRMGFLVMMSCYIGQMCSLVSQYEVLQMYKL